MGCLKCGKELETSLVFCDTCLEEMNRSPVKPDIVVNLPKRQSAPVVKKRSFRARYLWDTKEKIEVLQRRVRWLSFALILSVLCFLITLVIIFWLLHWQGMIPSFIPAFFSH